MDGVVTVSVPYHSRTPPLHPEDVNEIKKPNLVWLGGREGGTWGVPLNSFNFYSLSRKLLLSITTSTHANNLIR